jgi:hypothetical protein
MPAPFPAQDSETKSTRRDPTESATNNRRRRFLSKGKKNDALTHSKLSAASPILIPKLLSDENLHQRPTTPEQQSV